MKKDQLAFLLGGLAFGMLVGYGLFHALANQPATLPPQSGGVIDGPRGPAAMTQVPVSEGEAPPAAGGGAAPMIAEINALKKRYQDDPRDLAAVVRLGNLYQDAGMFAQAITFYERALDLAPSDPNILTDKGICHEQLQQFDAALALFRRAQAANPSHWQSLYNIVVVTGFHLGQPDEAKKALVRLREVNPDAPNLAALEQQIGRVASKEAP